MLPDVEIGLEWRGKRYRDANRGLQAFGKDINADFNKIGPILKREIQRYMEAVVKSVGNRMDGAYPRGTSPAGQFPGTLSKRSGRLRQQFTKSQVFTAGSGDSVEVRFTMNGIAVVHEKGATITPKTAQYLTVPLPPALNANGTPKKAGARSWDNTFVIRSRKGNLLIVQRHPGQRGITPLYVLKKSVTIPKRLGFEEAFLAGRDFLADRLVAEVLKEFVA